MRLTAATRGGGQNELQLLREPGSHGSDPRLHDRLRDPYKPGLQGSPTARRGALGPVRRSAHRFGGGYAYRAMVVLTHPMQNPAKTSSMSGAVAGFAVQ